jgi:hypothetical protein
MTYAEISIELQKGKRVNRSSWGDSSIFLFQQTSNIIPSGEIQNIPTLPQRVKDEFERRLNDPDRVTDSIFYLNEIFRVNCSNMITHYTLTLSDRLANDWVVLDY